MVKECAPEAARMDGTELANALGIALAQVRLPINQPDFCVKQPVDGLHAWEVGFEVEAGSD